jgi:hypothetical protein
VVGQEHSATHFPTAFHNRVLQLGEIPFESGLAENVAIGGRPRTWPCGAAAAALVGAVRGGCVLGNATVRPSGFWPYCTG